MSELLVVGATEAELVGAGGARTLVCGIGPVEAAAATGAALARDRAAAILHVGLAGARRESGLLPPSLVIGCKAVYADAAGPLVPAHVRPDAALLDAARGALPDARVLAVGTSARIGGTVDTEVEAMEGFAVLRAAELAGVPAVEVRAIANAIDEADRTRWRLREALAALAGALPHLIAASSRH